jgi:hypothetical protein
MAPLAWRLSRSRRVVVYRSVVKVKEREFTEFSTRRAEIVSLQSAMQKRETAD